MKKDRKDKLLEALERNLGIVTAACKEVGISRNAYYEWLKEDPDFKQRVEEIEDMQGDFVEHQLFKKIKEGSEKAIMFYMKYKGRKKGYAIRNEITGADGKDIFSNITFKFGKPLSDDDKK